MHALALLFALAACGGQPSTSHDAPAQVEAVPVRNVDVATLLNDLKAETPPLLIDVRTPEEFAEGRVPGAKNVPLDTLGSQVEALKSEEREIYVVCRSGGRSARAADLLARRGVRAVNVEGGTLAWQAAGEPIEH